MASTETILNHGSQKSHFVRSLTEQKKQREDKIITQRELRMYQTGEPSGAFFPAGDLESEDFENTIFIEDRKVKQAKKHPERQTVATLSDIENRKTEQLERYVEYRHYAGHPGNLTMAWRRFGIRHREEIKRLTGEV